MYSNVLVPLDGSPLAEIVLPYVYKLCSRFDLRVTFLHVCQDHEQALFMCQAYVQHLAETAQSQMKENKGTVSALAVSGNVPERILEQARQKQSDLILMAAHGYSGPTWMLGSVVHKVITATRIPVLVVREALAQAGGWPLEAIVPMDGSALSESVLPHAVALAKTGVKVTLLRVCEPPILLADYPDSVMPDRWEEHIKLAERGAEKACNAYLDVIVKDRLFKEGVEADSRVILARGAANGIIDYLAQFPSALAVMSTHGQSGFGRWPYGHVADRVLLASKNPILLVRPPKG